MTRSTAFVVVPQSITSLGHQLHQAQQQQHQQQQQQHQSSIRLHAESTSRRDYIVSTASSFMVAFLFPVGVSPANAGIDPAMLKTLPVEGDASGTMTRLKQLQAVTTTSAAQDSKAEDVVDIPYTELDRGVKYRDYRIGKNNDNVVVQNGSKVAVEMTIRCQSFTTAKEPGGVMYYSTKDDTEFNEFAWTVGSGVVLPELEDAMRGMHKNGLRRIIVPSVAIFAARKANQLPFVPTTKDGKRRFENLFKTDATLLFEVLVTRVK